ncbi:MAG: beta-lactamase family protein [Planctomycetes bacterium]|nr:beta-lactamase family protein [Planctomycetota bacterium]
MLTPRLGLLLTSACLTCCFAAAGELPVAKPAAEGMSAEKLAKVDVVMDGLVKDKKLAGGIVMIARHGNVVHWKSHGLMDIDSQKPMRDDAIFRIYSMSKAITTAAALILCDEGKLRLDDPVSRHLPEMKNCTVHGKDGPVTPGREMTVRDLMLHTAGLTYGSSGVDASDSKYRELNVMDFNSNLAQMTEKLSKVPLVFAPGTDWMYSVATDVLGRVVEVASGQPLDEFFQTRIFKPLDMKDTGFFIPANNVERFAANYNSDGKGNLTLKESAAKSEYLQRRKLFSGGGGLVSTARDYMRFLVAISRGGELDGVRILKAETVQLMTSNQLPESVGWIKFGPQVREGVGFGLGFSVRTKMSDWDPQGRVGEYGWGGAASTHYWTSPKDDLIVITLEQTMPYSFLTEFAVKGLIYDAVN